MRIAASIRNTAERSCSDQSVSEQSSYFRSWTVSRLTSGQSEPCHRRALQEAGRRWLCSETRGAYHCTGEQGCDGHARHGRVWESIPGQELHVSCDVPLQGKVADHRRWVPDLFLQLPTDKEAATKASANATALMQLPLLCTNRTPLPHHRALEFPSTQNLVIRASQLGLLSCYHGGPSKPPATARRPGDVDAESAAFLQLPIGP